MNTRLAKSIICLITAVALFGSINAGEASIKDRMVARLPTINALKDKGLIGENNNGYLEYRTGKKPSEDVINSENGDRRRVYGSIAKKQGVKPGLVGKRRAIQIADKGSKGHLFQKPDGTWYKK